MCQVDFQTLEIQRVLYTICRISYSDFVKTFTHLEVVHLDAETSRDEPSLHSKHTWQMKLYQGSWRRGVTAGGCRNNQGSIIVSLIYFLTRKKERERERESAYHSYIIEITIISNIESDCKQLIRYLVYFILFNPRKLYK